MLKIKRVKYYKVKRGQGLTEIARYFSVSPYLLARENGLTEPPKEGQILKIPEICGHEYVVQAGDTKELLCGSEKEYERLNGTTAFYIGMRVIIL